MHYTQKQLGELVAVARAATQGQWLWGPTPTKTVNAAVRWVAKMIRASTGPTIWEVYAGTPDAPRATAITGNGPDSEANAAYIVSAQPQTLLNLIEDVRAADDFLFGLKLWMVGWRDDLAPEARAQLDAMITHYTQGKEPV
jgi:hypothetical protein